MTSFNLVSSVVWFLVGLGFIIGGLKYGFGILNALGPGFLPAIFWGGVMSFVGRFILCKPSRQK